ncbi:phosphatidylserine decarboxylase [Streptomyces montanisoli]|uniref:Phosphatidylserine decarboxylase n=1 Tax=Streptomyces montanisoli TaxID=2798581 RepID=A0A940S176_9ACTN|nr:phosphatidylserine decarboxylase [Streptomyces montanisoli]MBP0461679.1 phosphatidylserine decarboxylase [Streptomyces montanisoli]
MNRPDQIVHDLQATIDRDDRGLAGLIEKSLRKAADRAEAELNHDVLRALEWPRSLPEYFDYLKGFIRWVPRQSDDPAWTKSAPGQRYAKEVSDRLAHFFWLTDQKVDEGGTAIAENSDAFRDWLTAFARQWGSFLDTPESFSKEVLDSFIEDAPEYHVEESLVDGRPNMPSGWLTFNQFFARELNPGLRPIAEPLDNTAVTSPADCVFQHSYGIDQSSNIPRTTIKGTHHYGNIRRLIEGSQYADAFAGGTFAHYMLPPSAYHRYHVPVSGLVKEAYTISGRVFMQVDLEDHELVSKDSAKTGYEFSQTRGVLTLDTAGSDEGDLGIVGVVAVGMSHVASVNVTAVESTRLAKGDEFGYFQFGGSDIIVLFQEGVAPDVSTSEEFRRVGSVIARCRTLA